MCFVQVDDVVKGIHVHSVCMVREMMEQYFAIL